LVQVTKNHLKKKQAGETLRFTGLLFVIGY